MGSNVLHSDGDAWKEIASRSHSLKPGITTQKMISRMNEVYPFSNAKGVFDNGCGSGSIITQIIETYGADIPASTKILAGDFSQHMLDSLAEKRRARIPGNGDSWERLEVRKIDAHDLSSIPDASISHVTGGHLYFLLQDPHQALLETNRVLCGGGVIAMSTGKTSQHIIVLHDAVEEVRPGTNLQLMRAPWNSEDGVKQELEATGFVDVETSQVETEVQYENNSGFAEMLLLMPVMKNVVEDFSQDEKRQLQNHVVKHLQAVNPAEPGALKGISIIAWGRKAK